MVNAIHPKAMSKTLVLGDIHGHDCWKGILAAEGDCDKVVVLGDYFDSFTVQPSIQEDNFKDLLEEQAKRGKDKFVLLMGNHDFHYFIDDYSEQYSGYSYATKGRAHPLLRKASEDGSLTLIHRDGGILFSHAGISNYWLNNISSTQDLDKITFGSADFDVATLKFNIAMGYDMYGNSVSQGFLWIRPQALFDDMIPGYVQVVGHTNANSVFNFREYYDKYGGKKGKKAKADAEAPKAERNDLWVCDALPAQYIVIEDGSFKVKDWKKEPKGSR